MTIELTDALTDGTAVVVEWRRGAWHRLGGSSPVPLRSLGDLVVTLAGTATGQGAAQLSIVLPRAVQGLLDEAGGFDDAGLAGAAAARRAAAARLLRSKRMRDGDIAYCLGVPLSSVEEYLPRVPR
jgi:hypothetical protein